jgi:hypothetical protein
MAHLGTGGRLDMAPGKHVGDEVRTARGELFVWTEGGWLWIPRK